MLSTTIYPSLKGRAVFITGGASGIGRTMVERFAAQHAVVKFVDIDTVAGERLAAELAATGATVSFATCDVREIAGLQTAIDTFATQQGGIDVLVNNAARDDRHAVADVDVGYWDERMQVNLRHQFFAAQAVHQAMVRRGGGSIINFGSIVVQMADASAVAYVTAKAAVYGMTRSLARAYGKDRIRVNCLVPGWVMTERQVTLWLDEAGEQRIKERQCLPDKVMPDDIANMALFLASDDSRSCTAQSFVVDAGWT